MPGLTQSFDESMLENIIQVVDSLHLGNFGKSWVGFKFINCGVITAFLPDESSTLFNLVSFRAELMLSAAAQLDRYATRQSGMQPKLIYCSGSS